MTRVTAVGPCAVLLAGACRPPIAAGRGRSTNVKACARIRALIDAGADVNAAEPDGTTPLHWAAYGGDVEATRLLLAAGAVANSGNRYGVRALSLAAMAGSSGVVEACSTPAPTPTAP